MNEHPAIGALPECRHCSARDWHECDAFRDDHLTLYVCNCVFCGSFGMARDKAGTDAVEFRGAFMR